MNPAFAPKHRRVVPGPGPAAGHSGPPRSLLPDAIAGELPAPAAPLRAAITDSWAPDEAAHLSGLLAQARLPDADRHAVQAAAADLVRRVRVRATDQGAIEAFMRQYDLGSEEGVLLMCVAEALLRIPDQDTADRLIRDKLGEADWRRHMGQSDSVLVNASTWGLMLTGHLVDLADDTRRDVHNAFKRLVGRVGEPVIRLAVRQAMRIMGHQFVMGRTIDEALARSRKGGNAAYRYSFDMLGEAALTAHDAQRYLQAYREAIAAIGRACQRRAGRQPADPFGAPSISVKLSALHPRYEHAKRARVLAELVPRVLELARLAKAQGIGFTIDAEEADRLEISLDVFAAVYGDPSLEGWEGCGLAVQAYQKRAPAVIDFIVDLARRHGRRIPLRLVKGAYWDSEVKRAQVDGYEGYPVFTRKPNTDVSYLACARRMFEAADALYPMFATHNAHTIAAIHRMAQLFLPSPASGRGAGGEGASEADTGAGDAPSPQPLSRKRERGLHPYEFQKLHGMGDDLYAEVIPADRLGVPCRVYAPVGSHEDLLPYLVRRLLENGANSSFVNSITDEDIPVEDLVRDPVETVAGFVAAAQAAHPRIPLPVDLFRSQGHERGNSMGINLANDDRLRELADQVNAAQRDDWSAEPLVPGARSKAATVAVTNPADRRRPVGHWQPADADTVERALANAVAAHEGWNATPAASRAAILEHAADLLEQRMPQFIALCTREAGKTIPDGIAEVREAVDFLRYYALQAREQFRPEPLPGPTGESNTLQLSGRGVFVCISPWNFPLAIFTGQVAAALAAGNAVLAKPAEQTNLVGYYAVRLLHEAGVPQDVLQFVPGRRRQRRREADRRPARVGRRLHRLDRNRAPDQPRPGRAPRGPDRHPDRRDRRPERADRRLLGAARAAGQGRDRLGVHLGRPALLGRAGAVRAVRHRRQGDRDAVRRDGRTQGRRPGAAVDRRRPGDRLGRVRGAAQARRADGPRGAQDRGSLARRRRRARHLLLAAGVRARVALAARARGVRPGAARAALERRPARRGDRPGQRHRLRPDLRRALADRRHGREDRLGHQGRQLLRQPQPDRRGGRCAAVRRPGPVRHRPQGRRPALPGALRHREDRHHQHHRLGRQCLAADARGVTARSRQPECSMSCAAHAPLPPTGPARP
jgi:RHH-type transcriptional regulator, proline utilization regulon repressor / proline dehydrogenase / delta 1-pyrroline-5-carboxylate dehydrogenase